MSTKPLPEIREIPLILGGKVDVKDIIGRDEYVSCLWRDLKHTSIVINEIRRFGKTTILRLMESNPPEGWLCVRTSVQDIRSKAALTELTLGVLLGHAGIKEKAKKQIRSFGQIMQGTRIKTGIVEFSLNPDFQNNAFSIFRSILKDVDKQLCEQNQKLVIIWDEFPDALRSVRRQEGLEAAEDIMSLFRVLREDDRSSNIRWVLTGSIGFHHVLQGQKDYINDMIAMGAPPLSNEWTCWLAEGLLLGIGVKNTTVSAISKISGGIPFVLEMLVKYIRDNKVAVPTTEIEAKRLLVEAACSPEYGTNWAPLLERVDKYYKKESLPIVKHILDILACDSMSAENLSESTKNKLKGCIEEEEIENILDLLIEDHYIQFDSNKGEFSWLYEPLKTIWLARRRGLRI